MHVGHFTDAASNREGHEAFCCGPFNDVDHRRTAMGARGDVEEDHFVRPLIVIAKREFHRVSHVSETAVFGASKLHSPRNFSVMDIEAGDNAFREHWQTLAGFGGGAENRLRCQLPQVQNSGQRRSKRRFGIDSPKPLSKLRGRMPKTEHP